ncbi:MAG TPA: PEP-CTERM sorting domain-containing protein [Pirellulales bacterium]|nr:PEP-CTERM sorting domain-containing protein [Pirellulales bacterium]
MPLRKFCYAAVLLLACSSPAAAALVVTVGDLTLTGSSGDVPVYISGTGDLVGVTEFELQITPVGSAPLLLEFANSPVPDPTFSDPTYIFFGQSGDAASSSGLGSAATTNTPNDTFYGLDSATDHDVAVTSQKLLGDVPLTTLGSPGATPDSYLILLIPSSSSSLTPTGPDGNTSFSNGTQSTYYAFTSVPGTVTVEQPSVSPVPEPGTFGLLLAGMAGMLWLKRRQRYDTARRAS